MTAIDNAIEKLKKGQIIFRSISLDNILSEAIAIRDELNVARADAEKYRRLWDGAVERVRKNYTEIDKAHEKIRLLENENSKLMASQFIDKDGTS